MIFFGGEKTHNRDQCNNLKTKNKTACGPPKIHETEQMLRREFRISGDARQLRG